MLGEALYTSYATTYYHIKIGSKIENNIYLRKPA